jgi:hypothetical protein
MEHIITGNFNTDRKGESDWVMGFNPEALVQSKEVGLKWAKLKKGENKPIPFVNKISKTLSVLITGKIKVTWTDDGSSVTLEKEGDFVYSPPGRPHTREVLEDSFIISIRWPAIDGDQQLIK